MHKYQIKEIKEKHNHAGTKALEDVCTFADEEGYQPLYVRRRVNDTGLFTLIQNQAGFAFDWIKAFFTIKKNSIILLQNPFKRKHLFRFKIIKALKTYKKCCFVSVIHDVEPLRMTYYRDFSKTEFEFMINNSDYLIVHNDIMKNYFISDLGISESRLISLEIFDYDAKNINRQKKRDADVVIAGNLEKVKSVYVYKLGELKSSLKIRLYGPNYEEDTKDNNVEYMGSFPAEEVPNVLDGKFGLVWDGEVLDTCSGTSGKYLRYNNPHKTSLYIVSGIPVVIWKEAAMARFVEKENVGICVNSLSEIKDKIDSVTDEEYEKMLENVNRIAERLEKGYYLKTALKKCEDKFCTEQRGN